MMTMMMTMMMMVLMIWVVGVGGGQWMDDAGEDLSGASPSSQSPFVSRVNTSKYWKCCKAMQKHCKVNFLHRRVRRMAGWDGIKYDNGSCYCHQIFYPKYWYLGTIWLQKYMKIHPEPFEAKWILLKQNKTYLIFSGTVLLNAMMVVVIVTIFFEILLKLRFSDCRLDQMPKW